MNDSRLSKNELWILLSILVIAFLSRAGYIFIVEAGGGPMPDVDAYKELAIGIMDGKGFELNGHTTAYRPPLYPFLLAGVGKLFGWSDILARLVNCAVGVLAVWIMFFIGKRIGGVYVGLVGAGIMAVEPHQVLYAGKVMSENLFVPLFLAAILFFIKHVMQKRFDDVVLCAIFAGLAALTRNVGVLIMPFVIVYILLERLPWKKKLAGFAALVIFFLGLIGIWTIRNYVVFKHFVPITTHGGYTLVLGNNESFYKSQIEGTGVWEDEDFDAWKASLRKSTAGMNEAERDRFLYSKATQFIRKNPEKFVELAGIKFMRMWKFCPASIKPPLAIGCTVYIIVLYVLAFIGLFLCGNRWQAGLLFLYLFIAFSAIHMLTWSQMRFRIPLVPLLVVLGALTIVRIFRRHGHN